MKIETRTVHAGDPKKATTAAPATTPIHTAASYFYDKLEQLGRQEFFRFVDSLKLAARAASLGDVHSMILHPVE